MAGRSQQTPRTVAFSDPLEEEWYPVKGRALPRAFAVAVALAAISPLFAADPKGCASGAASNRSTPQIQPARAWGHFHP
jgi:hypothetical protein